MAKSDFTKIEKVLDDGLLKMSIEDLHMLARKQSSNEEKERVAAVLNLKKKHQQLIVFAQELKMLANVIPTIYKKLDLSKKQLTSWLEHPEEVPEEVWGKILSWKKQVNEEKQQLGEVDNEKLVELERKKHLTKRYNINEKWLPL